jgi:hypothetical protein
MLVWLISYSPLIQMTQLNWRSCSIDHPLAKHARYQGWARDLPRRDRDLGLRDRDARDETEASPARDETEMRPWVRLETVSRPRRPTIPRLGLSTVSLLSGQCCHCLVSTASYLQHGRYQNVKSYQVMTAHKFLI